MRKILLSVLLTLVFLYSTASAQVADVTPISYSEALSRMYELNGNVESSQKSIEQKQHLKDAAVGLRMPQIFLDARYTSMDAPIKIETTLPLPASLGGAKDVGIKVQDQDFFKANIGATWPIFTGGKINAANDAADAYYMEAVASDNSLKNTMAHDLTTKYFGLQLSFQAAKLREDVYNGLYKHYQQAVSKEEAGTMARVERMHAEVNMNEAKRAYSQADKDIAIATAALKSILVLETDPKVSTPLFILDPQYIEPLDHFKSLVVTDSATMQQLTAYRNLADAGVKEQTAGYMPSVYLFGTYELYKAQLTATDPEWAVGIGAHWVIFEGFSGHNKTIAAKKAQQSVSHKISQTRKDLATGAEVYYMQLLKAYDRYKVATEMVSFTEEYLRVRTKSFEAGFATSIEVVDAQTALTKNKFDIMMAAYDFDIALSQLLSLCGKYSTFEEYRKNINTKSIDMGGNR